MAKVAKKAAGLADPGRLAPTDPQDEELAVVIIETPKGSRNKYAYDLDGHIFELKTVLPAGMYFPYDFGFVPSTRGGDGDPLDVLVLMDEGAFPGCKVLCRPIGVIEGAQGSGGKFERNDRVIAVERGHHSYAHVRHVDELGKRFVRDLEEFFVNYHRLSATRFRLLGLKGPAAAQRCIRKARKRARRER